MKECIDLLAGVAVVAAAFTTGGQALAVHPPLIPMPRNIVWTEDRFMLSEKLVIDLPDQATDDITNTASLLAGELRKAGASEVSITEGAANPGRSIAFTIGPVEGSEGNAEAYSLEVTSDSIRLTAPQPLGLFWGVQTIRQLIVSEGGKAFIAGCKVTDWPAFKWRGLMVDPGFSFESIELLNEFVEMLPQYKMNVLHLHLTDYCNWRLEIKKYPRLTEPAAQMTEVDGSFTQEEMKALVSKANSLHVTIIPEIDMPGHSAIFGRVMGFEMGTQQGVEVLKDILKEVAEVFDGPYIHLGTDEVDPEALKAIPPEFVPTMLEYVRSLGKTPIGWQQGMELDEKTICQVWTPDYAPLLEAGNRYCVDSNIFDLYLWDQSVLRNIRTAYDKMICGQPKGNDFLLGGELVSWYGAFPKDDNTILAHNGILPATVAFSERVWLGGEKPTAEQYIDLEKRMEVIGKKKFPHRPFPFVPNGHIPWLVIAPFPFDTDKKELPESVIKNKYEVGGKVLEWKATTGGNFMVGAAVAHDRTGTFETRDLAYALTYVKSEKDQDAYMWIGFGHHGPATIYAPPVVHKKGEWDNEGVVWLNDEIVPPPDWGSLYGQPGAETVEVKAFEHESYASQAPVPIHLKVGWNKILVRSKMRSKDCRAAGRIECTVIPVSWDGKRVRALEGVEYSTKPGL